LRTAAIRLADAEQSGTPRSPEASDSEDFSFPFDELGIGEPKPIPLQPKTIPLEPPKPKFIPQERKFIPQERQLNSQQHKFFPQERKLNYQEHKSIPQERRNVPEEPMNSLQEPRYSPQEPKFTPSEPSYIPQEPKSIPLEGRHSLLSGGRSVEPKSIPLERSRVSKVPVYARLVREAADSPQEQRGGSTPHPPTVRSRWTPLIVTPDSPPPARGAEDSPASPDTQTVSPQVRDTHWSVNRGI
jgi:hypothetical protein